MKKLILFFAVFVPATASAVPSHCAPGEQVVFSCQTGKMKILSLCASATLNGKEGYLQYRFGPANKPELVFPENKEHPKTHFLSGTTVYSGGGGAYLKFTKGAYTYAVYTGIGKGWEEEGVLIEKSGNPIASVLCKGAWKSEIGPDFFGKAEIPEDPDESNFVLR